MVYSPATAPHNNPLTLHYTPAANPSRPETGHAFSSFAANTLDMGDDAKLLSEHKKALHWLQEHATDMMKNPAAVSPEDLRAMVHKAITQRQLPRQEADQLYDQIMADLVGAGALEPYFRDPAVTEIMVVGAKIFIERNGKIEAGLPLSSSQAAVRLAQQIARHVHEEYQSSKPLMNLTWPEDGSRINITHHNNAPTGVTITIRKRNQERTLDIPDFIASGMFTEAAARFLLDVVQGKLNMIIAGPTGSGKTSVLRAFANAGIHPRERLLVLEDTEELRLTLPHMINLIGRPYALTDAQREKGEVTLQEMFRNALRMRPDRIIMGELRGPEAFDYIEAGLTEPGGMLTTIHIRQPEMLNSRLYWIAQKNQLNIPYDLIVSSVFQSTEIIVQVERDGNGHRHLSRIVETSPDGTLQTLFQWDPDRHTLVFHRHLSTVKQSWMNANKRTRIGSDEGDTGHEASGSPTASTDSKTPAIPEEAES